MSLSRLEEGRGNGFLNRGSGKFTRPLYVNAFYSVASMGFSSDGVYTCVIQITYFEALYRQES